MIQAQKTLVMIERKPPVVNSMSNRKLCVDLGSSTIMRLK